MDIQWVIDYLWNFGEKATSQTMRLHAFLFLTLALCSMSSFAQASTAGSSCSVAGAQERDSGQILICNGTTWVETIQTTNAGRSLFQIGNGTLKFSAVDAGADSVCALGNGELYCWGEAGLYQLGNASTTDLYVPTRIGTDKWQQLSSDGHSATHHCAIKPDKTLWCWGDNGNTQIGNSSYTNVQTPTNISSTWLVIAPEQLFACGVRTSGALYCWGTETAQQLGNGASGTTGTPTLIGSASWKWVTTGYQHACGIQSDNSLWCWGSNTSGQLGDGTGAGTYNVPTKIGTDTWKSVSASSSYTCGIKTDNTLWCWGSAGNHGDGTNAQKNAPGQVGSAQWRKVSTGSIHACGIQTDGTLWCWGSENWNGETGPPASANRLTATQVGTAKWVDVSTGYRFTCGIQADNTLWCWGQNTGGQLGRGSTSAYSDTVATTSVSTSASTTCASYETGRLRYNEASGGTLNISGLVGYWPMDETSGTSVADLSGNGNTGTMTNMDGATDHVPGVIGNGLDFDGTNDYVNAGSGASLDDLGDMTICAWINARATTGGWDHIATKYDAGGTVGWDMYQGGGAYSSSGYGYRETGFESDGWWDHYCAVNTFSTYLGSGSVNITIYKNSVPVNTGANTYGSGGSDAANSLFIGSFMGTGDFFNGVLDEMRVYNRALSATEIQQIYNYAGSSSAGFWQYCDGANWVDF